MDKTAGLLDRHAIRALVKRIGEERYGLGFNTRFLDWLYQEPSGTCNCALTAQPTSRKGKIIIGHFVGRKPDELWPGEEWGSMLRTYHPCLRGPNITINDYNKARKAKKRSIDQEAA